MRRSPGYRDRSIEVVEVSKEAVRAKRWLMFLLAGLVCAWLLLGCSGAGTEAISAPPAPVVTLGPPAPTVTIPVVATPRTPLAPIQRHTPGGGFPQITLSERGYDFGDIQPTGPVTHTFTFTNTGTAELVIERVGAS
jgi:hypothetical protein